MTAATMSMTRIEQATREIEDLRRAKRALNDEATLLADHRSEIEQQLESIAARRAAEMRTSRPRAHVLGECDVATAHLELEREAAVAAAVHAGRAVEQAHERLMGAERLLGELHARVRELRNVRRSLPIWLA